MKNIINILLMLIILSCSAFAISGGESVIVISVDKCVDMFVKTEALYPIDIGEYNFTGCNETNTTNYWECDCDESFDLILNTKPNNINSYEFTINYTTYKITNTGGGGTVYSTGGSGGGGYVINVTPYKNPALDYALNYYPNRTVEIIENDSLFINETIVELEQADEIVEINNTDTVNISVSLDEEDKGWPWWLYLILVLLLLIILLTIFYFVGVYIKNEKEKKKVVQNEYEEFIKQRVER